MKRAHIMSHTKIKKERRERRALLAHFESNYVYEYFPQKKNSLINLTK